MAYASYLPYASSMKSAGLTLLLLISTVAPPAPAAACLNEVVRAYVQPRDIRRAERVERLLARGNSRAAYRGARQLVDGLLHSQDSDNRERATNQMLDPWDRTNDGAEPGARHATDGYHLLRGPDESELVAIGRRAEMLLAILVVRVDGQIARDGHITRRVTPDVRAAHLARARATLARLLREDPRNPRLVAYDAEARAASNAPTSLATLRDLGARDLVTDPLTWVALANLESGDARAQALTRCSSMLRRGAARVCRSTT